MNIKGITVLALSLAAILPARALEERITLLPGQDGAALPARAVVGTWVAEGAVLRKAYGRGVGADLAGEIPALRAGFESGFGFWSAFVQLEGSSLLQLADHPETMNRCSGRLHEAFGSNMRSCRTKFCA